MVRALLKIALNMATSVNSAHPWGIPSSYQQEGKVSDMLNIPVKHVCEKIRKWPKTSRNGFGAAFDPRQN